MVMRYESIRGELSLPSLQELWQNGFGILEKGAECKINLGKVVKCQFGTVGTAWARS